MPDNTAAFFVGRDQPVEVRPAPYIEPKEDEIVVRTRAIAINPCDSVARKLGDALFSYIKYPHIFGEDVSGEIVALGPGVTALKVGDRVTGQSDSAFQMFPTLKAHMAAKVPDSVSHEDAAVIPLGLTTAMMGLFHKEYLGMEYPSLDAKPTGETVLIWGGSTSVGCNAVQLAASAGYEVISTASPHNFDLIRRLGASQVFDYKSPTVTQDLIEAFKGKKCAGAVAIGNVTPEATKFVTEACIEIVSKSNGRKFVALSMPPLKDTPTTVESKFIDASQVHKMPEFAAYMYHNFLTKALASGKFVPAPSPEIVGTGLEALQKGMDVMAGGVSAKKLVVTV